MEVPWLRILVWCTMSMAFMLPAAVNGDPIKVTFDHCRNSTFFLIPGGATEEIQCCPVKPTKPIIDGPPPVPTNYLRVRKASQCVDEDYAEKLNKAYALMRALPDDDPRSLSQQWQIHCTYCGGGFLTLNSSGFPQGIDIHWSWLFYPWHRWFLFFHERILQSLLGDPDFSLNYWNWDAPYSVGDGSSKDGACLKQGDNFPDFYADPSSGAYDYNRSESAKGHGRFNFPDASFVPHTPAAQQLLYNASGEDIIESNLNILYQALVSGGTTKETFIGRAYRAGEVAGTRGPNGGAGTFEVGAHTGVHAWIGTDPPGLDMGTLSHSARDPAFYAHHSNIDRIWQVWKDIGPVVGQTHDDYTDPDFLNAEFLFYDEHKDLRRVTVAGALDTKKLGYVYQHSNNAAWLFFNATKCSKLSYYELTAQAESLPPPTKDSKGYYHLEAGKTFTIVVDRPENAHDLEEFLIIDGIKLNRSSSTGFDVFVDWLNPTEHPMRTKCAEYSGRFANMAQSRSGTAGKPDLDWKTSISKTLGDVEAPLAPSKVVVSLVPMYGKKDPKETHIKFKCVTLGCRLKEVTESLIIISD